MNLLERLHAAQHRLAESGPDDTEALAECFHLADLIDERRRLADLAAALPGLEARRDRYRREPHRELEVLEARIAQARAAASELATRDFDTE